MVSGVGVAVILGTRPEIIKLAPVLRALSERGMRQRVVHTGQHYSFELDAVFFRDLGLRPADVSLAVGSAGHGAQTGRMLAAIERELAAERPRAVLVQGDTNSVLAGALAAAKLGIPVGHVEAGLRSDDRRMPEELNRIVADHLSTWWFAPTMGAVGRLAAEGISGRNVVCTGNTIADATRQHLPLARGTGILERLGLPTSGFVLTTIHRAENTDDPRRLGAIVAGLVAVAERWPVVFPVHPRTRARLERMDLWSRLVAAPGVRVLDPVGYLEFLGLLAAALVVVTDSGGVQEESCILRVPCVTVRDNTERPETVAVGGNRLVAADDRAIVLAVAAMSAAPRGFRHPFGDGRAGERIAAFLAAALGGPGGS